MQGFLSHPPLRRDDPVTQSGTALETQGTAMAPNPADPPPPQTGPHPELNLIVGFGVIVLGTTVVHIVFNVLV